MRESVVFMKTKVFSFDEAKLNQKELREKAVSILTSLIECDLVVDIQFTHEDINTSKVDKIINEHGITVFSEEELLNS